MFAVLELEKRPDSGILRRFLGMLARPRVYYAHREVLAARYLLLRATTGAAEAPDWETIEEACGRCADRLLLPAGISVPQGTALRKARLPAFEKRVLTATACAAVEQARPPMFRRLLGLVDLTGDYADQLAPLLRHYTCVKVMTRAAGIYLEESRRMMEQLGASVIVGDSPGLLRDCMLVLAPRPADTDGFPRLAAPVMTAQDSCPHNGCDWVTHLRCAPPPPVASACPPNVEPHLFGGALYEFSGLGEQNFTAAGLRYQGRESTLTELASLLAGVARLIPELNVR